MDQNKFHYYIYHKKEELGKELNDIEEVEDLVMVGSSIESEKEDIKYRTKVCIKSMNFKQLDKKLKDKFYEIWFDY